MPPYSFPGSGYRPQARGPGMPGPYKAYNPRAAVFYRIPVPSKSLYKLLDSVKSLCQIGDDVVDMLGAD